MLRLENKCLAGNGTVRSIRHVISRLFDQIFMTRSDERKAEAGKSGSKMISTLRISRPMRNERKINFLESVKKFFFSVEDVQSIAPVINENSSSA